MSVIFDSYEWGIVQGLIENHGYDRLKAITTVGLYIEPLRMLDRYENAEQKADILIGAINKGISAKEWVMNISKARIVRIKSRLNALEIAKEELESDLSKELSRIESLENNGLENNG